MKTITEILIDLSGSMKSKLISVKKILVEEVIPALDFSDKIGIKIFWSNNKTPVIKELLPISLVNNEQLKGSINSIDKTYGGTPIAAAIKKTVYSLKEYRAYNKRIILVTDGQETDGGNYELEAQNARKEGIDCEIHVIGINLNQQAIQKATSISTITKGTFSNIPITNSSNYNKVVIQNSLSKFRTNIKQDIQIKPPPVQQKANENIVKKVETAPKSENNNTNSNSTINTKNEAEINQKIEKNSLALKEVLEKIDKITSFLAETNRNDAVEIDENKELNEKIGRLAEKFVFDLIKQKYTDRVKWLNEKEESYLHHDFEIIDIDGTTEYYIECKGTVNNDMQFYITKEEWRLFLNNTKNYQIFFVQNVVNAPKLTKIDNLLDWLLKGKIVPYSLNNTKLKAERVLLTILE